MNTETEPKIHTVTKTFGELEIKLEGEQYRGQPILDTRVSIDGKTVCWISWENKDEFIEELQEPIRKYCI